MALCTCRVIVALFVCPLSASPVQLPDNAGARAITPGETRSNLVPVLRALARPTRGPESSLQTLRGYEDVGQCDLGSPTWPGIRGRSGDIVLECLLN